jgi:hypothetical protein
MRNLLFDKLKYDKNFADSVYNEMRKIKYGIQSCKKERKLWLDEVRKQIVEYQAHDDGEALTQVSINHMGWLPVYYPTTDETCEYRPPWCDVSRYQIQRCSTGPRSIGMNYATQNVSTNIIEVNSGGCVTRINVNPAVSITNNYGTNGGASFIHDQIVPATVWLISHNLGYVPNVWAVDAGGTNIDGTVTVIDNNSITLTFSTAVTGKAYLS